MRTVRLKNVIITIIVPLVIYCSGISLYSSFEANRLELIGILLFIYLLVPETLLVLLYVYLITILKDKKNISFFKKIRNQVLLALLLVIVFNLIWFSFVRATDANQLETGFINSWLDEIIKGWYFILYFALSISIIYNRLEKADRKPH